MSVPIVTFFNNKGGVGKTSLVYHLACTFADLKKQVVVVDLDPQANLTAAFFNEDQIEHIWNGQEQGSTIYQCVKPLTDVWDVAEPTLRKITSNLSPIPGDVALSGYEDTLSKQWPDSMGDNNLYRPMRILSSFWQVIQMAVQKADPAIVLVDLGPNLGAINRSMLIATDYVIIPLAADLFSLQGLENLGPTLRSWKGNWQKRLDNWNSSGEQQDHPECRLPKGHMQITGYLCQ